MTTKAHLAYGEFRLELEGSETFVVSQLDVFGAKIPSLKPISPSASVPDGSEAGGTLDENDLPIKEEKKPRRAPVKNGGPSCASRIKALIDENFFDSVKKSSDIAERLKEKATPYEGKHISAAVINLTKSGKLRRVKQDGVWVYVKP